MLIFQALKINSFLEKQGLFLIMSSLESWKEKADNLLNILKKKEVLTTLGVVVFMGGSYAFFKHLHLHKSPSMQYITQIHENIQKCWEASHEGREPLIIEEHHQLQSNEIRMKYTLVSKLNLKQKNTEESIRNPFLPPFDQGLYVQDLGSTHRLLFNKYNIYQQHLLVTTKEFQLQSTPLTKDDFKHTIYAFKALKGLYFFNSGPIAGASQKHKHIQIFPHQARDLPIFRNILEFCRGMRFSSDSKVEELPIIQYPPFRFKHGMIIIGTHGVSSESESDRKDDSDKNRLKLSVLKERSHKAYRKLFERLLEVNGEQATQYNLIGCQEFILMVPRSKQRAFGDISVNAVGFMGSILLKSKDKLRKYLEQQYHGYKILEDITFPK